MKKNIFYTLFTFIVLGLPSFTFGMESSQPTQKLQKEEIAPTLKAASNGTYKWLIRNPAIAEAQIRYVKNNGFDGSPIISKFKIEVDFSEDANVDANGISLSNTPGNDIFSSKIFTKGIKYLMKQHQDKLEKISIADMASDAQDKNETKEMNKAFLALEQQPLLRSLKIKGGDGNDTFDEYKPIKWKKIPQNIGFAKVTQLNLENLQLEKLPVTICYMAALERLYLSKNNLTSLPDQIGNLSNLEALEVSDNKLEKFPKTINRLTALSVLSFYNNKFNKFPRLIGDLPKLEAVEGGSNTIKSWSPITPGQFPYLKYLSMRDNQLSEIPQGIKNAKTLETIDFRDNKIEKIISSDLSSLENLQRIYLKGNPIQSISIEEFPNTKITWDKVSNNNNQSSNKRKIDQDSVERKCSHTDKSEE